MNMNRFVVDATVEEAELAKGYIDGFRSQPAAMSAYLVVASREDCTGLYQGLNGGWYMNHFHLNDQHTFRPGIALETDVLEPCSAAMMLEAQKCEAAAELYNGDDWMVAGTRGDDYLFWSCQYGSWAVVPESRLRDFAKDVPEQEHTACCWFYDAYPIGGADKL